MLEVLLSGPCLSESSRVSYRRGAAQAQSKMGVNVGYVGMGTVWRKCRLCGNGNCMVLVGYVGMGIVWYLCKVSSLTLFENEEEVERLGKCRIS